MRAPTLILLLSPALLVSQALTEAPSAAPAPAQADWRFAHPAATMVGGLRLQALLHSPIIDAMIEQAKGTQPSAEGMAEIVNRTLGQVEDVRFSVLDKGDQHVDLLLLVTGQFDEAIAKVLSQGAAGARRIDDRTVLLGTEASLDEAIQRMNEPPSRLQNRALVRGAGLTGRDFWIAGNLPETPMTSAVNINLRGLALAMNFTDDLMMEFDADTASPEMAEALIRMAREAEAQQTTFTGALETQVDDTLATFRVHVPQEEVLASIREGKAQQLFSQMSAGKSGSTQSGGMFPAQPTPAPKRAPAPKRNTIVIQGLADGTHEIPMTPPPQPGIH